MVAAIADAGGVTRAGEKLFLTQSALSHQLKDIEQRLGAPLFHRAGRRMILTPAGQRLLDSARGILAELERAEADIATNGNGGPLGVLRLATECYTCYHWLPPVLAEFRTAWPRVEVRLVPEATRRPLAALAAGELDFAIVSHRIGEEPPTAGRRFEQATLFDDELVAIVGATHRLAERDVLQATDFAAEQVLLYNLKEDESTLLNDVLRPAGVRPAGLARVELTEAIIELVKAGLGISMMARWAVRPHVHNGSLRAIPITSSGLHRRWTAVYRPDPAGRTYLADFARRIATNAFPTQPIAFPAPASSALRARLPRAGAKRPTRVA